MAANLIDHAVLHNGTDGWIGIRTESAGPERNGRIAMLAGRATSRAIVAAVCCFQLLIRASVQAPPPAAAHGRSAPNGTVSGSPRGACSDAEGARLAITRTLPHRGGTRSHEQKVNGSTHQEMPANSLVLSRSRRAWPPGTNDYPSMHTNPPTAYTRRACKRRPSRKRLKGFEPSTFCMASRKWGRGVDHKLPANRRFLCWPATRRSVGISRQIAGI
jgi:hypothetical protein